MANPNSVKDNQTTDKAVADNRGRLRRACDWTRQHSEDLGAIVMPAIWSVATAVIASSDIYNAFPNEYTHTLVRYAATGGAAAVIGSTFFIPYFVLNQMLYAVFDEEGSQF